MQGMLSLPLMVGFNFFSGLSRVKLSKQERGRGAFLILVSTPTEQKNSALENIQSTICKYI